MTGRFLLCLLLLGAAGAATRNILLLGGNGLLGGHTARRLHSAGHRLTCIHRGNSYWDWDAQLSGHFQRTLVCDRKRSLHECEAFVDLVATKPFFDLVIDFSGFSANMVDNVVEDMFGLFRRYIFISTDSVYEVSALKSHPGPSRESDVVRPASGDERRRLAMKDQYAEQKLRCEERLVYLAAKNNFTGLLLRLPDVLGPRDSTLRLWAYMVVLQMAVKTGQAVQLPEFARHWPISIVYADDVARLLMKLAGDPSLVSPEAGASMEAVNFASPDTLTLQQLLERVAAAIELGPVRLQFSTDPDALLPRYLMPSVTRGPIDTNRSRERWEFNFTGWDAALRTTTRFYRQQMRAAAAMKEPWTDPLIRRLHENILHLEALRLFDDKAWKKFLVEQRGVSVGAGKQEL